MDCIVIGAGPAGMTAAGTAAGNGAETLLFERNPLVGRKLGITGKGRCNLTNDCDIRTFMENVPENPRFLYSALSAFTPADTMEFFESLGVKLKTERGNRVFPESDRAGEIVMALKRYAERAGARIEHSRVTGVCAENGRVTGVRTESGFYPAKTVIICTGGISYPATGSTGDGYEFARSLGHAVTGLRPSLVGLESPDAFCGELAGLTLKNIALRLYEDGREIYSDFGELLFTHTGVSGPTAISASAHMRRAGAEYGLSLDLKPALDFQTLEARLLRDIAAAPNISAKNFMHGLLPASMAELMCGFAGIAPDKPVNSVTKAERRALIAALKDMRITGLRPGPAESAIVTSGGVDVSGLLPGTMGSRSVKGLYFAGEVIDVDGYTGGFNLQIAFSTGRLAGISAAEETKGWQE